jgi:hypothetical protein
MTRPGGKNIHGGRGKGGHPKSVRGAFGRQTLPEREPAEIWRLSQKQISVFCRQAIGINPKEAPDFIKKPLHEIKADTLTKSIDFIDGWIRNVKRKWKNFSGPQRKRYRKWKGILIQVRAMMQAALEKKAGKEKKAKKKT